MLVYRVIREKRQRFEAIRERGAPYLSVIHCDAASSQPASPGIVKHVPIGG